MGMTEQGSPRNELKRNAIGTAGIVFFVVAAAAPLAATLGASPLVFGSTGVGGPGAYLAAMVVLLLFAVGYATMSRHVTSAGGFAAYISWRCWPTTRCSPGSSASSARSRTTSCATS
jgi:amino acid transporter